MKTFVLQTKSISGDDYTYIINHPKKPTINQIQLFLSIYGNDIDEETIYENDIVSLEEVKNALTIPKKGKKLNWSES